MTASHEPSAPRGRSAERWLREALALARSFVYELDLADGSVRTAGLGAMAGGGSDERAPLDWWRARIHPDDATRARAALEPLHRGARDEASVEYRALDANGEYLWVLERARLRRDASRRPARIWAMVTDVGERRALEMRLEAGLERAERLAASGSSVGALVHDFNNALTAIRSHSARALARAPRDGPLHDEIAELANAVRLAMASVARLAASGDARPQARARAPLPGGTETILLVEDDPAVRLVIRRLLIELGYTVLGASDGQEALELWRAHEDIALVLTDDELPTLDGRALAERLRAERSGARVLLMTGHADAGRAARSDATPLGEPLAKPFTDDVLARRIRAILDAGTGA